MVNSEKKKELIERYIEKLREETKNDRRGWIVVEILIILAMMFFILMSIGNFGVSSLTKASSLCFFACAIIALIVAIPYLAIRDQKKTLDKARNCYENASDERAYAEGGYLYITRRENGDEEPTVNKYDFELIRKVVNDNGILTFEYMGPADRYDVTILDYFDPSVASLIDAKLTK